MHPTRAPARRRRNPYNTCHVATPMIIIDITIAATSQHWVRLLLSLVLALVLVIVFVFVVCTCIFTRTCSCIFSSRASTITQARYGAPPRVRQGQPTPNEAFACDHGARAWPQSHDAHAPSTRIVPGGSFQSEAVAHLALKAPERIDPDEDYGEHFRRATARPS